MKRLNPRDCRSLLCDEVHGFSSRTTLGWRGTLPARPQTTCQKLRWPFRPIVFLGTWVWEAVNFPGAWVREGPTDGTSYPKTGPEVVKRKRTLKNFVFVAVFSLQGFPKHHGRRESSGLILDHFREEHKKTSL